MPKCALFSIFFIDGNVRDFRFALFCNVIVSIVYCFLLRCRIDENSGASDNFQRKCTRYNVDICIYWGDVSSK